MDRKLVTFVALGVIASVIGGSGAVTCYKCNSAISSNCLDPFSGSGVTTCEAPTCTKGWGSGSGVTIVIRDCSVAPVDVDLCADTWTAGVSGKSCMCRDNLCNDGRTLKPMYKITVAAVIATIMAITWMNKI